MPVRSLHSSVLTWPARTEVLNRLRSWLRRRLAEYDTIVKVVCFGSITSESRWGVGSDLDLVVVVKDSPDSVRNALSRDAATLPVPLDLLVYSEDEWERMKGRKFREMIHNEGLRLYP